MIEPPVKTKSLIFLRRFINQLSNLVSDFEGRLDNSSSDGIVINLAHDIASLPFYFEKKREDEFIWLMSFIGYNYLYNSSTYDNNFHINLINNWKNFDSDTKDKLYLTTSKNKNDLTVVGSIQELARLSHILKVSQNDFNYLSAKIELILLQFSDYLMSIETYTPIAVTEKLKSLKQIFIESKTVVIVPDIQQYLQDKLCEIGLFKDHLNIPDTDEIRHLILINQNKISVIDKKYIQEFLKLHKYLTNQKDLLYQSIGLLKLQKDISTTDLMIDVINNQIGSYNLVYLNSVTLIVCLCENELVIFYELYETFDDLGVFKTNYQNEVLESLIRIGSNIDKLNNNIVYKLKLIEHQLQNISNGLYDLKSTMQQNIQAIHKLEDSIVSSFKSIETTIGSNFDRLSQNISSHLIKIESGIAYNNLITTVSAYQSYKINRQTKTLLPK